MRMRIAVIMALGCLVIVSVVVAETYSIPSEKLDRKMVYWGSAQSFSHAGEMDYQEVIKATPEYEEIKRKKIERGTGRYWILLSQASDRVVRAIGRAGKATHCDLITAEGYLKSLDLEQDIETRDVTNVIVGILKGKDISRYVDKPNEKKDDGKRVEKEEGTTRQS